MSQFIKPHLATLAVAAATTLSAQDVLACSMSDCTPGHVFPMNGQIPQNALAWFVKSSQRDGSIGVGYDSGVASDEMRVFIESGQVDAGTEDTALELEAREAPSPNSINGADELWLPVERVPVGTVLRVEHIEACYGRAKSSTLVVAEPANTPTTLGTLTLQTHFGPLQLWTSSGSCTDPVDSRYADVEVRLNAVTKPFADVLRFSLRVDGQPYRSTDWYWNEDDAWPADVINAGPLGPGIERVFAMCEPKPYEGERDEGVSEGEHTLQMVALLPDGTALESDVLTVDLTCPENPDAGAETDGDAAADPDGVVSAEPADASTSDNHPATTSRDAGTPAVSATRNASDGRDADANKDHESRLEEPRGRPVNDRSRDAGCSMAATGNAGARAAAVAVAALWLAIALRRPSRRRPR